ncbi:hypothetical protein CN327_25020 [Bacillus cereus]|uniref:hypothetical protein n=1 Tax=Bacillus nitratireducens TaxID=2026193 RepID=UPI000BED7D26|nr:hypothetical protein [Bacillus nitratireducens]PEE14369.1 hypothetical protein CON53_30360 [Bacillus cereus]MED0906331.1 hypothetical protein [Bacillus nitratireducens]PFF30038.1 hypothetical protein CN327_25020 [Bacillus cereus]PFH82005.1 hypothetical protein COI81_27725 [Bacillus cereus]PFI44044.1 hypothetical protein COI73_27070 [Bacillus cereus]
MGEKKFINYEKDPEYLNDYVAFTSEKFGKTYYLTTDVKGYTEYELEAYIVELEAYKKKKRKKNWIYFGCFVLFCIVLSVIKGYQNDELVAKGKPIEAPVLGRHVETEYLILEHPTLELIVDDKVKKLWVKQELYDSITVMDKVKVIEYKGEIKLDPRYKGEDLIIRFIKKEKEVGE